MQESYLAIYLGIFIFLIFAGKFIVDFHHEINKRNRYMETQIRLLNQIAKAQGVPTEKLDEIMAKAKIVKTAE